MKKSYKIQILDHNIQKFGLIIKANLNMFSSAEILIQVDQNTVLQINLVSGAKKMIKDLKWHLRKYKCQKLYYSFLSTNYWYLAKTAVNKAGVPGLMGVFAVFIRQYRTMVKKIKNTLNKPCKNENSTWASKYPIQIYNSITT